MYDNVTAVVPCVCPCMSACNSVSPQLRTAGSICAAVPLIRVTGPVAVQGGVGDSGIRGPGTTAEISSVPPNVTSRLLWQKPGPKNSRTCFVTSEPSAKTRADSGKPVCKRSYPKVKGEPSCCTAMAIL